MVAGNTGYDIVVPSSSFAKQHIDAGYLQPLDKSLIPNLSNLDPVFMQKLENIDPGNQYLVPWAWGYTTVGINKTKLQKALGDTPMPENAWDLVFDPTYTSKAKSCGIAFLDSPTEVFQPALHYLGKDPYSNNPEDYREAGAMLAKVRGDIRAFSSTIINDLGSGKYCVVLGWSGDINLAAEVAKEAGSEDNIQVLLPSTGAIMFLDTMAIPKDAAHPKNAAAFINFYLEPEQAARQINEMRYPTGNLEVQGLLDPSIKDDNTIVLSTEDFAKLVPPGFYNNQARQTMVDVFTEFKKGNG
jgi:putrescine transport system substrate-binding protein